jgi:uncharacterized membrane protein
MYHYLLLKSLHILGVIIFLGNIIITGFWKAFADRTKDWRIIAFSQRLVTYTDICFTAIGVVIIAYTGMMMAKYYNQALHIKWIAWGLSLFIASGLIWIIILIPVQFKLSSIAKQFSNETTIPDRYWTYEKIWMFFGTIATLLPLCNLYWMVFKPT